MSSGKILLCRQQGFSLIEVTIALLVFSIIMLGLAKAELTALSTQSGNLYRDEALRIAEEELSRLKSLQFSVGGTSSELTASAWSTPIAINVNMRNGQVSYLKSSQIIDIATTPTGLKRIDVTVGWSQGKSTTALMPTSKNHQTSLSTIIVESD